MGFSLQWFRNCDIVMTGSSIFVIVGCGVAFASFINPSD